MGWFVFLLIVYDSVQLSEVVGQEKASEMFHYVVKNTRKAAIGPLEYCAVARVIYRQGAGKKDPM